MAHENPGNRVYSFDFFNKEASAAIGLKNELTSPDMKTLLKHLARDKHSIVYDDLVYSLLISH